MRPRTVYAVGALVVVSLIVVSLAAASSPLKRYTFPAAAPTQVASPGTFSLMLPAEWYVRTIWKYEQWKSGAIARWTNPFVSDPVHTSVGLSLGTWMEPRGTTLDDIRSRHSFRGTRKDPWTPTTTMREVGNTFLPLAVGKVWRQSVLLTGTPTDRLVRVMRTYWLHRGVAHETTTGAQKELFTTFTFMCARHYTGLGNPPPEPPTDQCRTHNGQFSAIMQSLRLTP